MDVYEFISSSATPDFNALKKKKQQTPKSSTKLFMPFDIDSFHREMTSMKVKFPFLSVSQIKGRTLDKLGIPNIMGKPYKINSKGCVAWVPTRGLLSGKKKSFSERRNFEKCVYDKRRHTMPGNYKTAASKNLLNAFTLYSDAIDVSKSNYDIESFSESDNSTEFSDDAAYTKHKVYVDFGYKSAFRPLQIIRKYESRRKNSQQNSHTTKENIKWCDRRDSYCQSSGKTYEVQRPSSLGKSTKRNFKGEQNKFNKSRNLERGTVDNLIKGNELLKKIKNDVNKTSVKKMSNKNSNALNKEIWNSPSRYVSEKKDVEKKSQKDEETLEHQVCLDDRGSTESSVDLPHSDTDQGVTVFESDESEEPIKLHSLNRLSRNNIPRKKERKTHLRAVNNLENVQRLKNAASLLNKTKKNTPICCNSIHDCDSKTKKMKQSISIPPDEGSLNLENKSTPNFECAYKNFLSKARKAKVSEVLMEVPHMMPSENENLNRRFHDSGSKKITRSWVKCSQSIILSCEDSLNTNNTVVSSGETASSGENSGNNVSSPASLNTVHSENKCQLSPNFAIAQFQDAASSNFSDSETYEQDNLTTASIGSERNEVCPSYNLADRIFSPQFETSTQSTSNASFGSALDISQTDTPMVTNSNNVHDEIFGYNEEGYFLANLFESQCSQPHRRILRSEFDEELQMSEDDALSIID